MEYASLLQADRGQAATLIRTIKPSEIDAFLADLTPMQRTLAVAADFKARVGECLLLPSKTEGEFIAVTGVGDKPTPWDLAPIAQKLPAGVYRLESAIPGDAALGWMLAHYRFDHYLNEPESKPVQRVLLSSEPAKIDSQIQLAEAVALVRDLVNTPAADLGPAEFVASATTALGTFGAEITVHQGDNFAAEYPCIAAVGRAAATGREARLLEVEWGKAEHPQVAIIGKGICFDSGGLDIKPSAAMLLMKKDMGGGAHALALARLIMAANLPVRLHLLIPLAENAIGPAAFRPGDVIHSRARTTIEIGNTDAEGRLVLADALTRASEKSPALIIDFATLTGAARVALGPELPALFSNDEQLAAEFLAASEQVLDPLWRLPLWEGYADMLKSSIADINNAGEGGMAGAITAALFLNRFVDKATPWAHLDTFAWSSAPKAGRPKGGEAVGLRAAWGMLQKRFG